MAEQIDASIYAAIAGIVVDQARGYYGDFDDEYDLDISMLMNLGEIVEVDSMTLLQECYHPVERILSNYWPEVLCIAAELDAQVLLEWDDIEDLIGQPEA